MNFVMHLLQTLGNGTKLMIFFVIALLRRGQNIYLNVLPVQQSLIYWLAMVIVTLIGLALMSIKRLQDIMVISAQIKCEKAIHGQVSET